MQIDTDTREADALLARVRERAANLVPVLEPAARRTRALIGASLGAEIAPDGSPWPPRKPDRRRRPKPRTGALRASVSARAEPTALVITVAVPYAGYVNARRPFVPVELSNDGKTARLMQRGPAGDHWRGVLERVARYVSGEESRS